jgi:hypothetical protein
MSQHGLGLKKEGKKQNIDPVFNSSAVLFKVVFLVLFYVKSETETNH